MDKTTWEKFVEKTKLGGGATDEQKSVIADESQCLIVEAGPGSGKTQTIITKIAWNLYNGVAPEKILYITFTRKAAAEAKDRLKKALGAMAGGIMVCTCHKFALDYLRKSSLGANYPHIITQKVDNEICLGYAVEEAKNSVDGFLPAAHGKSYWEYLSGLSNSSQKNAVEKAYIRFKMETKAYTFDDTLRVATGRIAEQNGTMFEYVYVDEVQDSSIDVVRMFCAIGSHSNHIVVVGDSNQSIYGFIHANPARTFKQVRETFQDVRTVYLTKNFRSSQPIISLSDAIASKQFEPFNDLCPHTCASNNVGNCYRVGIGCDDYSEFACGQAEAVRNIVQKLVSNGAKYSDIAVLFNRRVISRKESESFANVQRCLKQDNVPYVRESIARYSDVLEACKNIIIVHNSLEHRKTFGNAFLATMSLLTLKSGIGYVYAKKGAQYLLREKSLDNTMTRQVADTLKEASGGVDTSDGATSVVSSTMWFCKKVGSTLFDGVDRKALVKAVQECMDSGFVGAWDDALLDGDEVGENVEETDSVVLSTIHKAKGLEYKNVIVVDCFEYANSRGGYVARGKDYDEDTRKLYVAVSRAKENVFIVEPTSGSFVDVADQLVGEPESLLSDCELDGAQDFEYAHLENMGN